MSKYLFFCVITNKFIMRDDEPNVWLNKRPKYILLIKNLSSRPLTS